MTLVQAWTDSLSLFKPKHLQLFVMVSIKSILDAYKLYVKYCWPFLLMILVLFFIAPDYVTAYSNGDNSNLLYYATLLGIAVIIYGLLFLAACFMTRPSIFQKDCKYLRIQFFKILPYWCVWGLIWLFIVMQKLFWNILLPLFIVSSYSSWYIFSVLFFADSDGGVKNFFLAMWQACKMIIYNLPLLAVMSFCFDVPIILLNIFFFIPALTKTVIGAFLMPIGVCVYANIYIKKVHDQFDLYFNKSQ